MKNYQEWYEKRKSSLLRHPQLLQLMRVFNRMMTVLMPLAYMALLGTSFMSKGLGKEFATYILVPASGFVLLTLVRKWINQPRPYETWGIVPLLDKDSSGNSMPSRHVFSATIISMACVHANLPAGLILLVLSALLGLVRVLGGVHYPKDVLIGYVSVSSGEFFSLFCEMQSKWAWPRNHLRVKSDHLLFCPCKVFWPLV